ncbi:glycosyltransferase [Flavobacterium sp. Sd200]|uniref:glycosyltransferase family 2 protein n=1 Tax=Flavobacterium sp. Sd200 TaxID=2692211 RepID=UPI001371E83B|nr:glycosyltransferase family 2 protein [Flavobacterium sp. Sd200]MXN91926.1 glycosyltransferase [Flavobacterium sp. Sd200]
MKFSVITINYNNAAGLEKTIKSVVSQTYTEFEFIIIDGGSNDGSKEIIEKYTDKISYWVSEKDKGVYNAMNKGIKAAKGDFVIFMNSGDLFFNQAVLQATDTEINQDYDIYYGNNIKKSPTSERLKTYPAKLSFSFFYSSSLNHQAAFIRRSLFDELFYYNEEFKIASDWEFFAYAICHKNIPYKYLDQTICVYDFTGISTTASDVFAKEKKESIKKYFPAFEEDYIDISLLTSKRVQQVLHIQKHKVAWKVLKSLISIVLLFVPRSKK